MLKIICAAVDIEILASEKERNWKKTVNLEGAAPKQTKYEKYP